MRRDRERERESAGWEYAKWKGATRSDKSNFDQLMIIGMSKEGKPRLRASARRKIGGVPADPADNFLRISADHRDPSTTRGRHHFNSPRAFLHSAETYALSPHYWILAGLSNDELVRCNPCTYSLSLASDSISAIVLKFLSIGLSYVKTSRRNDGNE